LTTRRQSVTLSFVKNRLLRFLCAVALGLILFDNVADAIGCHDSPAASTAVCHGCSCGAHIVVQDFSPIAVVLKPTAFVPHEAEVYGLLLPQLFFRPPRSAA